MLLLVELLETTKSTVVQFDSLKKNPSEMEPPGAAQTNTTAPDSKSNPSHRLCALLGLRLLDVSLRETLQDDLHFVPAESENANLFEGHVSTLGAERDSRYVDFEAYNKHNMGCSDKTCQLLPSGEITVLNKLSTCIMKIPNIPHSSHHWLGMDPGPKKLHQKSFVSL